MRRIAAGGSALDPDVIAKLVGRRRAGSPSAKLTPKEREELRELAPGIHPAILTYRGLVAAVEALAVRSPIPAVVHGQLELRQQDAESNAYFIVAEVLTNAVKHSGASRIDITIRADGPLHMTVTDNGIGGLPRDTTGSGLADRIAAFDGALASDSPAGAGTTIRAEIPVL